MRIKDCAGFPIPLKFCAKMFDQLGINPTVWVYNADNPSEVKQPNFIQRFGSKKYSLDGVAHDNNVIEIFIGRWSNGHFRSWTQRYFKWLLVHEACHQKYFYLKGNSGDPWRGLSEKERDEREERACNRYANKIVGRPKRDFKVYCL